MDAGALTFAEMIRSNPADPAHGTKTAYDKHKCRCVRCRAANAAWMKAYRHRLADPIHPLSPPLSPPHAITGEMHTGVGPNDLRVPQRRTERRPNEGNSTI